MTEKIRVVITETTVYSKDYEPADLAHACGVKGTPGQIAEWVTDSFPAAVMVDVKSGSPMDGRTVWSAQVGGPWGGHAFAIDSEYRARAPSSGGPS